MRLFLLIAFVIVSFAAPTFASSSCNIKGNVWFNTKEKIYHLPWCDSYSSTKIDTNYGERWFCTEQEAIDAGRRKASNCPIATTSFTTQPTQSTVSNDGIYYVSSWKSVLDFGYANWLTIFNEVSKFRPADDLLREESTKFFTQAFDELFSSTTLSSTSSCAFSDITTADQTLIPFIVQSCEKWIFKWSDGKFWPKRKLTNAEAIAVVIRMIDGMLDEKASPWYGSYYTKLASYAKQYPSVNVVSNRMIDPASNAKRGDVLELIYSLYKWVFYKDASDFSTTVVDQMLEVNQCKKQDTIFACTIDPDGSMGMCPASCRNTSQTVNSNVTQEQPIQKLSTLEIASQPINYWNTVIIPRWASASVWERIFTAQWSDVSIDSITFSSPIHESIWSIELQNKGSRISSKWLFGADGKVTLNLFSFYVKQGNTEELTLVVNTKDQATDQFAITLSDLVTSADSVSKGSMESNIIEILWN